jgi:hypothetical protein
MDDQMDETEAQWLTYAELGERMGCSATAARMHAIRRRWQRQKPNQVGTPVRVLVSAAEMHMAPVKRVNSAHERSTHNVQALAEMLKEMLAPLVEQLAHERTRALNAERRADEREAADRAEIQRLRAELAEARRPVRRSWWRLVL